MTSSRGRIAVTIGNRQPVDLHARCYPSRRLSKESANLLENYCRLSLISRIVVLDLTAGPIADCATRGAEFAQTCTNSTLG
jgi:hypothetical protein